VFHSAPGAAAGPLASCAASAAASQGRARRCASLGEWSIAVSCRLVTATTATATAVASRPFTCAGLISPPAGAFVGFPVGISCGVTGVVDDQAWPVRVFPGVPSVETVAGGWLELVVGAELLLHAEAPISTLADATTAQVRGAR
jgi:hypothetical protein